MDSDRIENHVELKAPQNRVWKAITDSSEFGAWFGVRMHGPFRSGEECTGQMTTTRAEHLTWRARIQDIEPEQYFAWTWHPCAVDPNKDYSEEVPTLVEFRLSPTTSGGTVVTVTESGFDDVPDERRGEAFAMNQRGWAQQMVNLREYLNGNRPPVSEELTRVR